jgi:hypothetical protein
MRLAVNYCRFRTDSERRLLGSWCMADCLSVFSHVASPNVRIFVKFEYWRLLWKPVERLQIPLKSDSIGHFAWRFKYGILFSVEWENNRQLGSGYFTLVSRERCVLASSYLSVCLYQHISHWTHFPEIWYVEKLQIQLKSDKIIGHLNTQVYFIMLTATCVVLPWKHFQNLLRLLRITYLRQQY